jgi:hypothetical protein
LYSLKTVSMIMNECVHIYPSRNGITKISVSIHFSNDTKDEMQQDYGRRQLGSSFVVVYVYVQVEVE